MNRSTHVAATCTAVLVAVLTLLVLSDPASAAPACDTRVIADWSDNGRVDRVYRLHCYEDALAAIPPDIRDYTDAADVIQRALTAAVRGGPSSGGPSGPDPSPEIAADVTSSASSLPIPLLAIGVVTFVVLSAGGLAHLVRRRHAT